MKELEEIKEAVEKNLGVEINSKSRKRPVVFAKKLYCTIAKIKFGNHIKHKKGKISLTEIGKLIGQGHDTVLHHYNDFIETCQFDFQYQVEYFKIVGNTIGLPKCKLKLSNQTKLLGKSRTSMEMIISNAVPS